MIGLIASWALFSELAYQATDRLISARTGTDRCADTFAGSAQVLLALYESLHHDSLRAASDFVAAAIGNGHPVWLHADPDGRLPSDPASRDFARLWTDPTLRIDSAGIRVLRGRGSVVPPEDPDRASEADWTESILTYPAPIGTLFREECSPESGL